MTKIYYIKMKKIKINLKKIKKTEIDLIVDYLNRGKVIAYPTDTIYGLGCLATNKKAINKIYRIKKRDKNLPLLILVSSLSMLKKYCYVSKKQEDYLSAWTSDVRAGHRMSRGKPVSFILKGRGLLPNELAKNSSNLAIRLPKNDLLITILKKVNVPIVSTSLNISREKSINNLDNLEKYFKNPPYPPCQGGRTNSPFASASRRRDGTPPIVRREKKTELPDLAVDAGKIINLPSKIIDIIDINNIKILRN